MHSLKIAHSCVPSYPIIFWGITLDGTINLFT